MRRSSVVCVGLCLLWGGVASATDIVITVPEAKFHYAIRALSEQFHLCAGVAAEACPGQVVDWIVRFISREKYASLAAFGGNLTVR